MLSVKPPILQTSMRANCVIPCSRYGERHVHHRAQGLIRLRRLVADRLFEKVECTGGHALAERRRLGDTQSVVIVDAEHGIRAQFLA
jgi:hypothetical protein